MIIEIRDRSDQRELHLMRHVSAQLAEAFLKHFSCLSAQLMFLLMASDQSSLSTSPLTSIISFQKRENHPPIQYISGISHSSLSPLFQYFIHWISICMTWDYWVCFSAVSHLERLALSWEAVKFFSCFRYQVFLADPAQSCEPSNSLLYKWCFSWYWYLIFPEYVMCFWKFWSTSGGCIFKFR